MEAVEHTLGESATPSPELPEVEVTFVVIGYNEARTLKDCLRSVKGARRQLAVPSEILYVDGGSQDESMRIAREEGVDRLLGGDRRRKAAENRNLGLRHARGRVIQFVDGDMSLAADWPEEALRLLDTFPEVGAVCGILKESRPGLLHRALEIDWFPEEGPVRHCGGAAMYRREILMHFGGFPEHLDYGEEPYLCWRVRNELHMQIYQSLRPMARHDLGYASWGDYWRRNVRVGATYAEIAYWCAGSSDPLWFREAVSHTAWAGVMIVLLLALLLGSLPVKAVSLACALAILAAKAGRMVMKGHSPLLSIVYAFHTYFAKLPLSLGELQWVFRRLVAGLSRKRRGKQGQ